MELYVNGTKIPVADSSDLQILLVVPERGGSLSSVRIGATGGPLDIGPPSEGPAVELDYGCVRTLWGSSAEPGTAVIPEGAVNGHIGCR